MELRSNTVGAWVKNAAKAVTALTLLVIAFSPVTQIFQTPVVHAETVSCVKSFGTVFGAQVTNPGSFVGLGKNPPNPDGSCNAGYVLVGDSTGTVYDSSTKDPSTGKFNAGLDPWATLATWLAQIIYVFTVGLGSLVAYLAGNFLNFTIYISLNSTAYAAGFLTHSWEAVRNMANMGFIFILIYIAINVTLKADTHDTMRTLVRVIIFALIINFSFFGARLVIDMGNILAVNFYNKMDVPAINASNAGGDNKASSLVNRVESAVTFSNNGVKDLTAPIMGALDVQGVIGTESFKKFAASSGGVGDFFTTLIALAAIYLCVGAIFLILAMLFFTVGIKFIVRVAVLWVVIISAPIAFLMAAVPDGKKYFNQWAEALVAYSVYPAVFLFMYLIIMRFVYELACPSSTTTCTTSILSSIFNEMNRAGTNVTGIAFILQLIVQISVELGFIILLLYFALQASNMISKWGGSYTKAVADNSEKFMLGSIGWAGRNTVGKAGYAASRSEGLRNLAANSAIGRTLWRGANTLGTGSFDARGSKILKDAGAFNTPAGGKGGYLHGVEERAKAVEKEAKALKTSDVDKEAAKEKYRRSNNVSGLEVQQKEAKALSDRTGTELKASMDRLADIEKRASEGDAAAAKELDRAKDNVAKLARVDLKAKKRLNELDTSLKTHRDAIANIEKAQKARDAERVNSYADQMSGRRLTNMWMPSLGSTVGAEKARHSLHAKSTGQQMQDLIDKAAKEQADKAAAEKATSAPPPTPPAGGGGATAKPAAPKHDDHGGGAH